ncbi:hypothetical protein [Propylenella binzhouense]|nr:hypothetical protein [Propylenella binzhouense]
MNEAEQPKAEAMTVSRSRHRLPAITTDDFALPERVRDPTNSPN